MNVTRMVRGALLGAGLAALAAGASLAATTTATPSGAPAATPAKAPAKMVPARRAASRSVATPAAGVVEPEAVAALSRMSAYLRTHPTFEIKMTTQRDEVDDFNQVLTFDGETTYKVKVPDGFNIQVLEGDRTRDYVYDGKSVTIYDPKTGFYARFPAPPTIRQTLDLAAEKYGITVPIDDLFQWNQGAEQASKLTSGHWVGPAKIDGQDADHYAFRQSGADWQIWIAKGDKPVPLRVVIVTNGDPAKPQFEANLAWNDAPQFTPDTFVFTPPPEAKAIPLMTTAR